jgi:hypothetical protein
MRPLLFLCLVACGRQHIVDSVGGIDVSPAGLDFGSVAVGTTATAPLTLTNTSQGTRSAHVTAPAPFAIDAVIEVGGGASKDVAIPFAPAQLGPASAQLTLTIDADSLAVALSGSGAPAPICAPPDDCHGCDGEALADGTACTGADACLTHGSCAAGRCVGTPLDCDDGNACTLDVCEKTQGCQHLDSTAQCPGANDPCLAAACDPAHGCTTVAVSDGTLCGAADCDTAHVCMSGQCKVIAVPEGFECAPESPCQDKGVCHSGTCERPPKVPLTESWHYEVAPGTSDIAFDGVSDPSGNLYWVECKPLPSNVANPGYWCDVVSYTSLGFERFRTQVTDSGLPSRQLLSADRFVYVSSTGGLHAISTQTGSVLWAVQPFGSMASVPGALAADDARIWLLGPTQLLVIDAATGATLTTVAGAQGLVLDASGNAFTTLPPSGPRGLTLASYLPSGALRFTAQASGQPAAAYNGQLVTNFGTVQSSLDGSVVATQLEGWAQAPGLTPMMTASAWSSVGSANACAWCPECDCASDVMNVGVRGCTAGSATHRFETTVATQSRYSPAILLSGGGVLAAGLQDPDTATKLRGIDAQGAEQFACELPQPLTPGDAFNYTGAVALTPGGWAVLKNISCGTCLHNPLPEIDFFPVRGLSEAAAGWTSQYGGPARANHPH